MRERLSVSSLEFSQAFNSGTSLSPEETDSSWYAPCWVKIWLWGWAQSVVGNRVTCSWGQTPAVFPRAQHWGCFMRCVQGSVRRVNLEKNKPRGDLTALCILLRWRGGGADHFSLGPYDRMHGNTPLLLSAAPSSPSLSPAVAWGPSKGCSAPG